jgi:hypothetical protein
VRSSAAGRRRDVRSQHGRCSAAASAHAEAGLDLDAVDGAIEIGRRLTARRRLATASIRVERKMETTDCPPIAPGSYVRAPEDVAQRAPPAISSSAWILL